MDVYQTLAKSFNGYRYTGLRWVDSDVFALSLTLHDALAGICIQNSTSKGTLVRTVARWYIVVYASISGISTCMMPIKTSSLDERVEKNRPSSLVHLPRYCGSIGGKSEPVKAVPFEV